MPTAGRRWRWDPPTSSPSLSDPRSCWPAWASSSAAPQRAPNGNRTQAEPPLDPIQPASAPAVPHLWTVILAGGVGSRFWPVSTPARPKQLLPLASERPLIRDTVDRVTPLVPPERLRILTGERLADPLLGVLP